VTNDLSAPVARDILERMLMIRRFEETVIHLAIAHKEVGRNHLYIGHEAIAAPAMALLQPGDRVHTTHRNHGYVIARGADPGRGLAEILARDGGLCGGRGGTFHLCDRSVGFGPTSALVGGSMGLAVGAALAMKKGRSSDVSVAHFGDGTLDEGIAYEALNLAALQALPVLFLCENNSEEGEHSHSSMLAAARLSDVPRSLGIDCELVDGGDAAAVHATIERVLRTIRTSGKPVFVEARIVRWPGCYQIQPGFPTGITDLAMAWGDTPITGEHVGWLRDSDPVLRFVRAVLDEGLLARDAIGALDRAVAERIAAARTFAEASPFPRPEAAALGVFA
jgi:TPP-dependent pyruvate/acetoin dehydrogenase alpha subunit